MSPHPPQSLSQRAVREGRLNQTLEGFNAEIGKKTAIVLSQFHVLYVLPLEQRCTALEEGLTAASEQITVLEAHISWLEAPWWKKALALAMSEMETMHRWWGGTSAGEGAEPENAHDAPAEPENAPEPAPTAPQEAPRP